MVSIRLLILNSRDKLLVQKTAQGLQIPQVECMFVDGCLSIEDIIFVKLSSMLGITDIHPKDLRLYYFSNKIEDSNLCVNFVYKGRTRLKKLDVEPYKFMELREIKKAVTLFKDKLDEHVIRRFIIREDNPNLLCE